MPMRKWQKFKIVMEETQLKKNAGWGNLSAFALYNKKKEGIILENPEIRTLLDEMTQKLLASGGLFDLDQLEEDIAEAENRMGEPGFGTTQKRLKS